MTGTCRRCGDDADTLSMVGWCGGCSGRILHGEARARQEVTLTATWVASLNGPDALDRLAAADADDDGRIVAWCKASARMPRDGG